MAAAPVMKTNSSSVASHLNPIPLHKQDLIISAGLKFMEKVCSQAFGHTHTPFHRPLIMPNLPNLWVNICLCLNNIWE